MVQEKYVVSVYKKSIEEARTYFARPLYAARFQMCGDGGNG